MTISHEDIHRSLGQIEGKLDTALENHEKRLDDHAKDIGSLKRWRAGVVAVGGFVAAALGISLK